MMEFLAAEPAWLQAWVYWMMAVNTASVLFVRHRGAQLVLALWIGNIITMSLLFEWNGYNRLLGLSHVIWWTPLLVLLWRGRRSVPRTGLYPRWLAVVFVTDAASLVIDYVDVVRYALGDRG